MGGRLTVGLQTLDLRIGVRIPASQPFIRQHFLETVGFPANVALRWHCGLLRSGRGIELVDVRDVRPWNQMAVDAHRDLDRKNTMSEILRDRI